MADLTLAEAQDLIQVLKKSCKAGNSFCPKADSR